MKNNKSYSFLTTQHPETEIYLSGRPGYPLNLSFTSEGNTSTIKLDTESIIRLQTFLEDYLKDNEQSSKTPSYEPTGRALAIIDGKALDFVRVFHTGSTTGLINAETDSYVDLMERITSISDTEIPSDPIFVFFNLYDGTIAQAVLKRVIRACIAYQVDFIRTGDPANSRRMVLEDIEDFTTLDASIISRATRSVLILTRVGTFSLDAAFESSPEIPSLFDEGVLKNDGSYCSRKHVLKLIKNMFALEDPNNPFNDEYVSGLLNSQGYIVARRTVAKYRTLLGIPKRSQRKKL